jgi:hypothetical protein
LYQEGGYEKDGGYGEINCSVLHWKQNITNSRQNGMADWSEPKKKQFGA